MCFFYFHKNLYIFFFFLFPFSFELGTWNLGLGTCSAQSVGIFGSTNLGVNSTGAKGNIKAIFDISSSDKGILIPRITTVSRDTFTNVPTSLLFFNTTTNQYEYYNGATWSAVAAANTNWSLTGNAGTVDGTNFIGTKDDVPFNIRVNNFKAGRIESANGTTTGGNSFYGFQAGNSNAVNYFLGQGLYNTATGFQALFSNTTGIENTANGYSALSSNTTGNSNTANGTYALYSNTTGASNTAFGYSALYSNTDGFNNTASGWQALFSNVAGYNGVAIGLGSQQYANDQVGAYDNTNTSVGYESLRGSIIPAANTGLNNTAIGRDALLNNSSGNNNTGHGYQSLFTNTTGNNNTAIGYGADVTSTSLTNATAIGYFAKVDASNTMVLGGTGANAVNVGIGTTMPLATLDITRDGGTVLFPRKSTAGDPAGAANGMIYYNANANKFRAYENGVWVDVVAAAGISDWSLLGNAGTVDGTNFIGTTDDKPFNIRVNNQKAGRIETNSGAGGNQSNSFFGYFAGNSKTTGSGNAASGLSSLFSNTIGGGNSAYGAQALYSNVAGSNATAVGFSAMQYANDQAIAFTNYNVAVGYEALRGSVTPASNTGNNNTSLGYQTLLSNTSGDYNSATGFSAMYWNTTGDFNTAYGASSLLQNSTGSNNTAVGYQALYGNTASNNTAVGTYALGGNTSGTNNTAMGYQSLFSNVTSHNNSAFGTNALVNNTYGSQNTALGSFALYTQSYNNFSSPWTTDNVAVGYQALYNNQPTSSTNGYLNTAIGTQAMLSNTSGSHNTAIGRQSLYLNASGSYNTASGYQALFNNAGFENTATGYFSLYSNTSGTGNVALGFQAGYTANAANANTTGSYNIFIGNNSGPGVPSASNLQNAIAIGKNALVDASNTMVLGGTGADAVSVGIGTTLPLATLDITRDGGTVLFPRKSSVGDPAGAANGMIYYNSNSNKFRVYENGAWADMTTGGGSAWSLLGNAGTVDGTNFLGTTDGAPLNFRVNSQKGGRISSGDNLFLGYAAGTSSSINVIDNIAIGDSALYTQSFGTPFSSHNVALGNSALFLSNPTATSNGDQNTAIGNRTLRNNTDGYSNSAFGFDALYSNSSGDVNTGVGILSLNANTTGNANTAVGGGALFSNLSGNGNVALGYQAGLTGTPANANVSGSFNTYLGYNAGPASATQRTKSVAIGYNALVDADNAMVLGGTGADAVNVGIGTTSPKGKLHIAGDAALGDGTSANEGVVTVFLTNNTGAASVKGEIVIVDPAANNSFVKTTTAGHTSVIGVVYESGVAAGMPCRIAISGIVSVVADAATTRGQHCITGTTTAGAAGSVATPGAGTSIGVWLENVAVAALGKVLLR